MFSHLGFSMLLQNKYLGESRLHKRIFPKKETTINTGKKRKKYGSNKILEWPVTDVS